MKLRLRLGRRPRPGRWPWPRRRWRRWTNHSWAVVEEGGQSRSGDWTADDAARLHAIVSRAHAMGLWIRFYTLNGHAAHDADTNGWSKGYNFGSLANAEIRWKAVRQAKVDFVATDQYEDFARKP